MDDDSIRKEIEEIIISLVRDRGTGRSICPSEVARACRDEWRDLMPVVREVAAKLQEENQIQVTQRGETVQMKNVDGPIRLTLPENNETDK